MLQLADIYRAALSPDAPATTPEVLALESELAALCARGRAAHPSLPLADVAFVEHLARCAAPIGAGGACAEDLFLACAALAGMPDAVEQIRRDHWSAIAADLRTFSGVEASPEEVEQRLWERLLVNPATATSALGSYSGRGPLNAFLGILARRIALDGHRRQSGEARAVAKMTAAVGAVAHDAELMFIKLRYKDGFEQAIRDALSLLDDRERMILRMNIVDGVTFDRIAKVYGVTQSTVSRWMAQARASMLAGTRRLLRERLQVSESDFDSIADLVISQIDLSVSHILRPAP